MMQKKPVPTKQTIGKSPLNVLTRAGGARPSSGRVIINAANVQKIGAPANVSLQNPSMPGQSVTGVGLSTLNDPSKALMNFNIQGTNGKYPAD